MDGRLATSAWLLCVALSAAAQGSQGGMNGLTGKSGNDTAQAFDLSTGLPIPGEVDLLPEGNYPYDATIRPDGSEIWVAGASGDGVVVLDFAPSIRQRIDLTGIAEYPVDVIFEPCGTRAFVASRDSEVVAIVDAETHAVLDTVPIPTGFLGAGKMAISGRRNTLYVVDWFDALLVEVDLDTLATTDHDTGDSLWDLVVSPDEDHLYVTDRGTDEVHVVDLDTMTVVESVPVGDDPWGIDITPDGATVVVANEDSSSVTVFDTATLTPQTVALPVGADPRDVEIEASGAFAYVPSGDVTGDDAIYVIDVATATLADTIDIGGGNPNVVAVRPQPGGCELFEDGFESGDTASWDNTVD